MSSTPTNAPASTGEFPRSLMHSNPEYAALLDGSDAFLPQTHHDGKRGVEGLKIQPVLLPSNLGSSRGGIEDTAGGPAYVYESLELALQEGRADVRKAITIDCQNILKNVSASPDENILHAAEIRALACQTRDILHDICSRNEIPILHGGDHSSALATAGVLQAHPDPQDSTFSKAKVIVFDGDLDYLGEPGTSDWFAYEIHPDRVPNPLKGNSHGRTFSTLQGFGPKSLMPIMNGVPLLRPENTLFIGGQRADSPEVQRVRERGCQHLDLDTIRKKPEIVEKYLREFVGGQPYHVTFDPDLLTKLDLIRQCESENEKPGAPMATIEGMSINTFYWLCRILGSTQKPASVEVAEVAPKCDKRHGGLTRQAVVGAMMRVLGGGIFEYHLEYTPFE